MPAELDSAVADVTSLPEWKNGDATKRRGLVRDFAAFSASSGLPETERGPLLEKLYDEAGARGFWGTVGYALTEAGKSVPAGAGALVGVAADVVAPALNPIAGMAESKTAEGTKTRLKQGFQDLGDSFVQRIKSLDPNDYQELREKSLVDFKTDLDSGAYPPGLVMFLSGDQPQTPEEEAAYEEGQQWFTDWSDVLLRTSALADQGEGADKDEAKLSTFKQGGRGLWDRGRSMDLLGDYIATRDPASWDGVAELARESELGWKTRFTKQKEALGYENFDPENSLLDELSLRAADFQRSPIDMAMTAFPLFRGAKAIKAAYGGKAAQAIKETAKSAAGEFVSGAATEALSNSGAATNEQILESGGLEALGGGTATAASGAIGAAASLVKPKPGAATLDPDTESAAQAAIKADANEPFDTSATDEPDVPHGTLTPPANLTEAKEQVAKTADAIAATGLAPQTAEALKEIAGEEASAPAAPEPTSTPEDAVPREEGNQGAPVSEGVEPVLPTTPPANEEKTNAAKQAPGLETLPEGEENAPVAGDTGEPQDTGVIPGGGEGAPVAATSPSGNTQGTAIQTLRKIAEGEPVRVFHGSKTPGITEAAAGSSFTTSTALAGKYGGELYIADIIIPESSPLRWNAEEALKNESLTEDEAAAILNRPNDLRTDSSVVLAPYQPPTQPTNEQQEKNAPERDGQEGLQVAATESPSPGATEGGANTAVSREPDAGIGQPVGSGLPETPTPDESVKEEKKGGRKAKKQAVIDEPALRKEYAANERAIRETREKNLQAKVKKAFIDKTETRQAEIRKALGEVAMTDDGYAWTAATEDEPLEPTEMLSGIPMPKFANRKMSELDKVTVLRQGKLQKSEDDARRAMAEIKRVIPDEKRQAFVSVWMEAAGDEATLKDWEARAKQPWMKEMAKGAQSLSPAEIAIAEKARAAYDALATRGMKYEVLGKLRDNYVTHVWDVEKADNSLTGTKRLKENFKFAKARTFATFFDGDQADFKPKTVAIGRLIPAYIVEMNRVIADRQFVKDLSSRKAKDGRPLVVPRGRVQQVEKEDGVVYLATPRSYKTIKDAEGEEVEQRDYKTMENQSALSGWRWEAKDTEDNPIFMKDDVALHPEAFRRLNSILGQSRIRDWYREPVEGVSKVPRAILKGLDVAQATMKREMFGFLSPFHQVQEGTHAIGHLVNPFFGVPKIDLRNKAQARAASMGLMLVPDKTSAAHYIEGVGARGSFISQISRKWGGKAGRVMADIIDGYQTYLFEKYIPGLKFKTFEKIEARNRKRFAKELASGELTADDVGILSAEQSNAAYGHLNYALLDRNPTVQHFLQLGLLAPDFLEARARFTGQAIKGIFGRVGHEQLKAIAVLAGAQIGMSILIGALLGDGWDKEHPFEIIHGGRRYFLRSVPEDIFALLKDTRQFIYGRVNPLVGRGLIQYATGLNYRGEKTDALETTTELFAQYVPLTLRHAPGLRELTESTRQSPTTPLEQLAGSMGLRISRYSPISETYKAAADWMEKEGLVKDKGSYPISKYQQLRYALEDGDMERAAEEYQKLRENIKPGDLTDGFRSSVLHPFTQSRATDQKFRAALDDEGKAMFDLAKQKRTEILQKFYRLPKTPSPK